MIQFLHDLNFRNQQLFIFGGCNIFAALIFVLLTRFSSTVAAGVNAWFKPFKFALSIGVFSWTMGWYSYDLHLPGAITIYNWVTIVLLSFEIIYIALQAAKGQLSHYNISSPMHGFLFQMMGLAAATVTLWTGYIGILFFNTTINLPDYYLWGIRIGIVLFVIFAFEGAAMGGRASHTVGGPGGGHGLPVVKWSTTYGDLRIAHFIGMHALQIVPLLSWYVLKSTLATAIAGVSYAILAIFTLVGALKGRPLIKYEKIEITPQKV